jgi:hypothetical protein
MRPFALAALLLLGPPLVGALVGAALRAAIGDRPRALRSLLLGGSLGLLAAPLAVAPLASFSIYDEWWVAALLAAGAVGAGLPRRPRRLAAGALVAAAATVVAIAALEPWARRLPDPPPRRRADELHLRFSAESSDPRCVALYPDAYPGMRINTRLALPVAGRRPGVRRVLHVGDSMVAAGDVPAAAAFTALLSAAHPDEEHLNLGDVGTGPDAYYLILDRWLPSLRPDEVLLYVYLGTDVSDMDDAYVCCDHGPLLRYDAGVPPRSVEPRCPSPRSRVTLGYRLTRGPSPYALRVLGTASELLGRVVDLMELAMRGRRPWRYTDYVGSERQLQHLEATLGAIRDRLARDGVRLTVVLLPPRWTLERHAPDDPFRALRARVLSIARAEQLRVFDAWDLLQEAVDREPESDWFQSENRGNPHLGVAGHRLLARWLDAEVRAR